MYNDVETARDYDVGMHDVASQKAHAIVTRAGVQHGPDVWDCRSDDGYMCACKRRLPGAAPPLSLERLSGALRSLEVWSQAQ